MTTSAPIALRNALAATASCVTAAGRALTVKHAVCVAAFGLAWAVFVVVIPISIAVGFELQPSINAILSMQLNGFAVLFAVLIADQAAPPERRRLWPYAVAVAAGVLVGSLVLSLLSQRVLGLAVGYHASGPGEQFRAFFFRHATHSFVVFGLATCVYVSQRWAAYRIRVLRTVQLDHAEMEKRLLESRLAAMQAQVEPGFLQRALEGIARTYETDTATADLRLRNLIVYLRAAIPRVRQPVSTVAEEVALAEAYLNALDDASGVRLMQHEDRNRAVDNARMPSMILLPLLHRTHGRQPGDAAGSPAVVASIRDGRMFLTIRGCRNGFANDTADDVGLTRIRERLAALYGDRARLELNGTAGRSVAVLEIPYETAAQASA